MPHPVIGDGEIRLRPASADDFEFLRRFFSEPEVFEHWGGAALSDDEIREKYLGARSPAVECFIVEIADRPLGLVQYHALDGKQGGGMDMALLPEHRGRGVGTSVVLLLTAYVREQLGWTRFTVDPDVSNARGVNFWRKVGFSPVELVNTDPDRDPYWLMEWPRA